MPFTIGPKIHNVIPKRLKRLIETFFSIQDWKGLYLTGGTCLAEYYFGHRLSEDIDLFTCDEALFQEASRLAGNPFTFGGGVIEPIRRTPSIAQFLHREKENGNPIKIDVVFDYTEHIGEPVQVGSVWIDSLNDMLCNKLGCMIARNEVKDFLDLYYLIPASHMTTKELVDLGLRKEGGLDPLIMADQMEFLFHLPPPRNDLLKKTDWKELKLFFKKFQKELLELIRPS